MRSPKAININGRSLLMAVCTFLLSMLAPHWKLGKMKEAAPQRLLHQDRGTKDEVRDRLIKLGLNFSGDKIP